jgi:hypothetical protein
VEVRVSSDVVELNTAQMADHAATLREIAAGLRSVDLSSVKAAGRDEVFGETDWLGEHEADKHLRRFADRWEDELRHHAEACERAAESFEQLVAETTRVDRFGS